MRRTALAVIVLSVLVAPLGCTKAQPSRAEFCRQLRETPGIAKVLENITTDDPKATARKVRDAAQQFHRLERSAPREIRSEVTAIGNAVDKVAKAVTASPDDPRKIGAALKAQQLDFAGAAAAGLKLTRYGIDTCHYDVGKANGFDLGSSTPLTTAPGPPTT